MQNYGKNYEMRKCIKCDTIGKITSNKYIHYKHCKDCWFNLRVKCETCDKQVHQSISQCLQCCAKMLYFNI